MIVRYRQSQCDDEAENEIGKQSLWRVLICGRRRTVKSISTATQVTSLEIAQKFVDFVRV